MTKDVPTCAEPGNTKQARKKTINAAKRWCFTLNNYNNFDISLICAKISQFCRYGIIGAEVAPSTGTKHLQGYFEFKDKRRPIGLFGEPRIHFELARGSKADNITYCSKENVIYEFPKKYCCEIENLYPWQQEIVDVLRTSPDDRTINWYFEPEGCRGKTTFQKYVYGKFEKVVVLSGKGSDMKNGVLKYYEATQCLPEIILINVPRCSQKYISYQGIEEIKDMFFFSPKYEGGMVCGPNPHVCVFANEEPELSKMSSDRWNVVAL